MSIVKSLSVGNGDMFYIRHNTDNFTIIDCCMSEDNRESIVDELKSTSSDKGIIRFISTHPDNDHIMGLAYLHERMQLLNFYCVMNLATKEEETDDFNLYCELRDDIRKAFYLYRGCSRNWMNLNGGTRKHSGLHILWPITGDEHHQQALAAARAGECPNNISTILKYGVEGGATFLWLGDLDSGFMTDIQDRITMEAVDILFAPHHGRDSGTVPSEWLEQIRPKLIVIGEAPYEHLNYYEGYDTITQNSAGDITFECEQGVTHIYVSDPVYSVDFLNDEGIPDTHGRYIGTLNV